MEIGGVPYVLDHNKPQPYDHYFESLFSQSTAIAGEIAKQQLRPEKLLWYLTDFSGGEGYRIYYPTEPTRYDQSSLMNVLERGILTTRTRRRRSSVARAGSSATVALRPAGGSAWDKAMVAWGDNVIYATDALTWTAATHGLSTTSYDFFDSDTDGRHLVLGDTAEGGTANIIVSLDGSATPPTGTDLFTGTTASNPPTVTEVMEGVLYAWTVQDDGSLALLKGTGLGTGSTLSTVVYDSNVIPSGTWGTDYWTDIEAAETALYMSIGTPGGSVVFSSTQDIGRAFWTSPPGFTIKKLIYHEGVLFCMGAQTAAGKRFAALWAIPLSTRAPIFVAAPRRHRNEELYDWTIGCGGYGSTIFIGDENSGKIFLYDIERNAIELFDDLANGGDGDGTVFNSGTGEQIMDSLSATFENNGGAGGLAATHWNIIAGPATVDPNNPAGQAHTGTFGMFMSAAATVRTDTGIAGYAVTAATDYIFGYWYKGEAAGTQQLAVTWYDSGGSSISTDTDSAQTEAVGAWQRRAFTLTSPVGAAFVALTLTTVGAAGHYADDFLIREGSITTEDKLAFLAMHGSRLFGCTYQPDGTGTSLQLITWDDSLKENRDSGQPIVGTWDSSEWDYGVPQELKALNGVYVTHDITDGSTASGLIADSRITISYAADEDIFTDTFTDVATITSATTTAHKGRHFLTVSDDDETVKFSRIKFRITLDNNGSSTVAPPILYSAVPEAQLMAYSEVWDLIVRIQDEAHNERPLEREWRAYILYDNLESLATSKEYVELLDGVRYQGDNNRHSTHIVQVEDPHFVLENLDAGEGYCTVRLRSVPV